MGAQQHNIKQQYQQHPASDQQGPPLAPHRQQQDAQKELGNTADSRDQLRGEQRMIWQTMGRSLRADFASNSLVMYAMNGSAA